MASTRSCWFESVMALVTLFSVASGQIEPHPDGRVPFAPFPNNGPVAGTSHFFFTGAMGHFGGGTSILAWNGNTGTLIPSLAAQGVIPGPGNPVLFPFSVHRYEADGAGLANLSLYNGRANLLSRLDYLEDDDPQRLNPENFLPAPGFGPRGGRAFLNRRSHLRPENQAIVPILASTNNAALGPCFVLATPCKLETFAGAVPPNVTPDLVQGGVLLLNYGPLTVSGAAAYVTQSPAAMSIWTSSTAPPAGLLTNSFSVTPTTVLDQAFVCSDLATGVISNALTNASPSGVAWISRTYADAAGNTGDRSAAGQLNIAALSGNPATVSTVAGALASPFSPFATKILVWNDLDSVTPQAQWLMIPCRDGVELWNPRPAGGWSAHPHAGDSTAPGP